jgi:osmotically-inducible protein OsmY
VTTGHFELAHRVSIALKDDPRTRDAAIDAVEEGGTVTLTGTVTSEEVRRAAEEIAQQQEGVLQVISKLQIEAEDQEGETIVSAPPAHEVHRTFVGR